MPGRGPHRCEDADDRESQPREKAHRTVESSETGRFVPPLTVLYTRHMPPFHAVAFTSLTLTLLGCGAATDRSANPDLPDGWQNAEKVTQFLQFSCSGSALDGGDERMEVRGGEGTMLIEYFDAHFRCAQDVEAYSKEKGNTVEVLVQPVDMDPESIAGCDCLYEIHMVMETEEEQDYEVALYRRWDHQNDDNEPVEVASESVSTRYVE